MVELLVWPALIAYGQAAFAYAAELRGAGGLGRLGIWGVRIGWLAQTGLLVAQALSADGFAWGGWAAALNFMAWLVVSGYLVWGCRPRYHLLGLAVMPIAVGLLALAWVGGGTGVGEPDRGGWVLAVHAVAILAAFACFTVASAASLLYLLEERRLKRRDAGVLRLRLPPLEALERVAARVALAGLALLSLGIVAGLTQIERGDVDATMTVTIAVLVLYGLVLVARREAGLTGRRFAHGVLVGFALVAVVLPVTHFAS